MDKTIQISLGIFIVILVVCTGIITYTRYTETAYRNTLTGTYTYTCNITTSAPVYNVTLFIPVPADITGNSPMVSEFSNHRMKGVPPSWETILYDTGKSTLLKVMTPAIIPPSGTSPQNQHTITFSSETTSHTPIDTQNPVEKSVMFRPVQTLNEHTCPGVSSDDSSRCFSYRTSMYADYRSTADATVTITCSVSGKNSWTIFEPSFNEYHTEIRFSMKGENHGWALLEGELSTGIGTYDFFTDSDPR